MEQERAPQSEPEPPTLGGGEVVPSAPALRGPEAQTSERADHASRQSGLWAGADPTLRSALLILIVVWYGILLVPPTSSIFYALGAPLANALIDRFQLGDILAFMIAYALWACLWQSFFAVINYFACGWPPVPVPGQPSPPHGLGPALRATYWYLLADAILFFPFFVLYLLTYSGFQIGSVLSFIFEKDPVFAQIILLLLGGCLLLNGLLALTLGLGAYWLASRLGRRPWSNLAREEQSHERR